MKKKNNRKKLFFIFFFLLTINISNRMLIGFGSIYQEIETNFDYSVKEGDVFVFNTYGTNSQNSTQFDEDSGEYIV